MFCKAHKPEGSENSLRKKELQDEGEKIISSIREIQMQLLSVRSAFANVTDEALIDSYIYEIIALHKKYEYFLKEAKALGLVRKIS